MAVSQVCRGGRWVIGLKNEYHLNVGIRSTNTFQTCVQNLKSIFGQLSESICLCLSLYLCLCFCLCLCLRLCICILCIKILCCRPQVGVGRPTIRQRPPLQLHSSRGSTSASSPNKRFSETFKIIKFDSEENLSSDF